MIDEARRPGLPAIRAARDKDVVRREYLRFEVAPVAGRVDTVDVVCNRIGNNRPRPVAEGRLTRCTALADDGARNALPCVPVVV